MASHEHRHVAGIARKVKSSLARGICSADNADVLALIPRYLRHRGAVVNADAMECLDAGNVEHARCHSGSDDHAIRGELGSVIENDNAIRILSAQRLYFLACKQLRAKSPRLSCGAVREISSGDTGRKTEIVLDE